MILSSPKKISSKAKVFVLLLLLLLPRLGQAAPNYYEVNIIKKQVEKSFFNFLDMWKEELYFDMYELGQKNSQTRLSKSEFAQRMVDLPWKPSLTKPRISTIEVDYRNFTLIHCVLEMENKINSYRKVLKKYTFHVILEKGGWKFDLTQVIKVPFIGKFIDLEEEKKRAAEQATLDAQKDAEKAMAEQASQEAANANAPAQAP